MELRAATTATRLDQRDACSLAYAFAMFECIAPQLCTIGHCVCNYFLFENSKTLVKSKLLTPHKTHTHTVTCQKTFSPPTDRTLSAASQWPSRWPPLMVWAKLQAETDESLCLVTQAKSQCSRTDSRSVFHFFHVA